MSSFVSQHRSWVIAISGFVVVAAAALGWWWLRSVAIGANSDDPQQVELGRTVYVEHCASCHGDRLQGQPKWRERLPNGRLPAPPHDETGHTWHHADEVLFGITKRGLNAFAPGTYESDMPVFGEVLTNSEIWAVLAFIKHAWPPDIQARQERITQQWQKRK